MLVYFAALLAWNFYERRFVLPSHPQTYHPDRSLSPQETRHATLFFVWVEGLIIDRVGGEAFEVYTFFVDQGGTAWVVQDVVRNIGFSSKTHVTHMLAFFFFVCVCVGPHR